MRLEAARARKREVRRREDRWRARVRRLRRTRTAPPRLQWQAAREPARAPLRGAAGPLATRTHRRRRDEHASQRRSRSRLAQPGVNGSSAGFKGMNEDARLSMASFNGNVLAARAALDSGADKDWLDEVRSLLGAA